MSNLQRSPIPHSYLFTVRVWQEGMGEDKVELRGEIRHVLSGELRYFRDWNTLITYLADKVHEQAQEG